ncbi:MmcQ/YjbR family DNA-binding protein [Listeria kieliensis]|uniref:MmcQ/YjbR family DNA-binding protein n=1 Tax=Listeria kieliensis TaxID=1621700 RepID=UPI001F0C2D92|nr:MmcQ/YjbR family DNA-binding protein [Listeria kieliensis]
MVKNDPLDLAKRVAFCLTLDGAVETFPFGEHFHVMRVYEKMFALIHYKDGRLYVSAKCEPEKGEHLREEYQAIIPGYHLNKTHWISVVVTEEEQIDFELEKAILANSYQLVFSKLSKKKQAEIRGF